MPESYAGKINRKLLKKQRIIAAAAGREPADLVLKNATFVNVFSNELVHHGHCRGGRSDRGHGKLSRPV